MRTTDSGMTPQREVENIRRLGDTADDLAERTCLFWPILRSPLDYEAYRTAVAVAVAAQGIKPIRRSIWFHAVDHRFLQGLSLERLARVFRSDGISEAREQAELLAKAVGA